MTFMPSDVLFPRHVTARSGAVLSLLETASPFGRKGLLVHGHSLEENGLLDAILADPPFGVTIQTWRHTGGEPTTDQVDALRERIRKDRPDWVAAVGGGSVMDLTKAAAGLADAPEKTRHYQLAPKEIPAASIPVIAAPTTAGTGSEATIASVLTDPATGLKRSIRHPTHLPRLVILDPLLLRDCPPATRAASGLDAFIQAYESLTSRHATAFTRALSEAALVQIARSLQPFYEGDSNQAAPMLQASFTAGVAFCHARLGIIHGLAHPLGARFHVAHGLACAFCLPACLAFNESAIRADLDMLRCRHGLDISECAARWLEKMVPVSPFKGGTVTDRDAFIRETLASGSTAANPRPVTADDVGMLLDRILAP